MLFGEFFAVGQGDQGCVQILGVWQPQGGLQQQLAWGVVAEISATHDVGDALVSIIDHDGQWVSPQSIGPAQDKITANLGRMLALRALAAILPVHAMG